ncbi:MAG: hypothetical protein QXP01_08895, partial [Candidatus Hadarchaeum sp.]
MEDILNLLKKALEKHEFDAFLRGEDGYVIKPHEMVPAGIPTDWTAVMSEGVYRLYAAQPYAGIDAMFERALVKMATEYEGLYACLNL